MAGVKITDLDPLLTTPDSGDLFYIVDISDTTESPQGTSKQIEVGNLFESGTWIPTFSGFNDAVTSATLTSAIYQRVGNIVNCSIFFSAVCDFSTDTGGGFLFTLPIATSSNFSGYSLSYNIFGAYNGYVKANEVILYSQDTSLVGSFNFVASFQYEIV